MQACRSVQVAAVLPICARAFRLLCHRVRGFVQHNQIGRLKAKQVLDAFLRALNTGGAAVSHKRRLRTVNRVGEEQGSVNVACAEVQFVCRSVLRCPIHDRLDGVHCLVSSESHCASNNSNTLRYRFMNEKAALPRARPRFSLASGHQFFLAGSNSLTSIFLTCSTVCGLSPKAACC